MNEKICEKDDPATYWKWRAEQLMEKIEMLKTQIAILRTQCNLYKHRLED